MVNYQLGKIYRIVCNTTGLTYYGSTCRQTLAQRLTKHVCDYKRFKRGEMNFIYSFKILENDNYSIVLVETYPCNTADELHARERYWVENNECVNKQIPSRTKKEYLIDTHDVKIQTDRNYYQKNKAKWVADSKIKYMCICGFKVSKCKKTRHEKTQRHQTFISNNNTNGGIA